MQFKIKISHFKSYCLLRFMVRMKNENNDKHFIIKLTGLHFYFFSI